MPDVTYSINAQLNKDALTQSFVAAGITADCSASGIATVTVAPGTNAAGTVSISTATLSSVGLFLDRKSTRLNSSHVSESRMPSSA